MSWPLSHVPALLQKGMSKHTHYLFPTVTAFWYLLPPDHELLVHLCLLVKNVPIVSPPPPTLPLSTFYQHNFVDLILQKYFKALSLVLGKECGPQAVLPLTITLIKSASLRSAFGCGSFFQRPAARLMACLRPPLCACAQPSVTVSRLGASLLGPPRWWVRREKGGGLRTAGREGRQEDSFPIERIKEEKESEE